MKYYIIAGESSGDMYGAALMQEILLLDAEAQFRFWGGKAMRSVSPNCDTGIEETSFMGLMEVLLNLRQISRLFTRAKKNIIDFQADILILIDYPGFNLRMAKWAKLKGIKVAYYISPQIWAWRKYRFKQIKRYVDLFFPILPFEQKVYSDLGLNYNYYGHPLVERIPESISNSKIQSIRKLGLFPGSRLQEVRKNLPVLAEFAKANPTYSYYLSVMPHIDRQEYDLFFNNIDIRMEADVKHIIKNTDIAIACSGTLSLELALYNVLQIVIYKTNRISYFIAKKMIKAPYISLVNLIMEKRIVDELIQDEFNLISLQKSFEHLKDEERQNYQYTAYQHLRTLLGDGTTSKNIARRIISFLKPAT